MNSFPADAIHLDPYQGFIDTKKELNLRFGFRLGTMNLLIRNPDGCEILKKQKVFPLPNTPTWVKGLINHHGVLIPVIDIRVHIASKSNTTNDQTMIAIGTGADIFAFDIDGLPVTIDLDQQELTATEHMPADISDILRPHIIQTYQLDGKAWYEIDYQKFVTGLFADTQPN